MRLDSESDNSLKILEKFFQVKIHCVYGNLFAVDFGLEEESKEGEALV